MGGANFGHSRRADFHRIFTDDVSTLQGECAVLVQILRGTPQDVPLRLSCHALYLQVNIPDWVMQGHTAPWFQQVHEAWLLLQHIAEHSQGNTGVVDTCDDPGAVWAHTISRIQRG